MNIPLRTEEEIVKLREACKLAADVLVMIEPYVKEGITTGELDRICHDYMVNVQKVIPACLNYHGFPKATCISLNEVVCHGIPSDDKKLKHGDILNIDVTVIKDGYFGDNSKMYVVGETNIRSQKLVEAAQEALYVGLRTVKPGIRLNEIGKAVQKYTESQGFSVVREYCGHGIGTEFHCEPQVLHYFADDGGVVLKPGMVFTIEPMINAGSPHVVWMDDEWTVVTEDLSLSAHYENTILITKGKPEILSLTEDEKAAGFLELI